LYCCYRCNLYKAGYWPKGDGEPLLWNPREEPAERHLALLADGSLYAITPTGAFTLRRLRLNRTALMAHRLRKHFQTEEERLLMRLRELTALLTDLQRQRTALLEEQRQLLEQQRTLIRIMLGEQASL
jgi:hypothetical protein